MLAASDLVTWARLIGFRTHPGLARAENWSANTEFDEFLRASIDPTWPGDMPRTLLISPSGQVKTIPGTAQMSEVERWLETVGR